MTSPAPPAQRFYLLFICLLVVGAGNSMLFAVLPPLVRRLQLPDSTVGWVFSLSALLWMFASPYWGRVSDRTGRKPIAALGLLGYAVSMSSFACVILAGLAGALSGAAVFAGLLLTRAIFGGVGSASSPAANAYVADHTSLLQRMEKLSGLTAAFALGQAAGPGLAGLMATRTGLVFPIFFIAGCATLAAFLVWRFLPEAKAPGATTEAPRSQVNALRLALDPRLSAYLLYGLGMSAVMGVLAQIFTLFVIDRLGKSGEAGAELAALGFMLNALAVLTTQTLLIPRLKLGSRALMVVGAAIAAGGVALQMSAGGAVGLLGAQAMQGLGFGLARPGQTGGASMAVSPQEQGAAAGLVVSMSGAGYIFSPLIGGVAYERLGMLWPLWFALALLAGLTLFALFSRRLRASGHALRPNRAR